MTERDGLVLYPSIIVSPEIERTQALRYILRSGSIRQNKQNLQRYRYVREISQRDMSTGWSNSDTEPVKAFSGSQYPGLVSEGKWKAVGPLKFSVSSSVQGESILIKPTLRATLEHLEANQTMHMSSSAGASVENTCRSSQPKQPIKERGGLPLSRRSRESCLRSAYSQSRGLFPTCRANPCEQASQRAH